MAGPPSVRSGAHAKPVSRVPILEVGSYTISNVARNSSIGVSVALTIHGEISVELDEPVCMLLEAYGDRLELPTHLRADGLLELVRLRCRQCFLGNCFGIGRRCHPSYCLPRT